MSKLAAIKKKIAELEAEAERIAKQEMSGAIAKVKEIMSTFGLTIEHLQSTVVAKKRGAGKKLKAKRTGGGVAKYADPKAGKTWSGFGRAPGWIAGVKNRDSFLVDKSGVKAPEAAVKAPVVKKAAAKKALAKKVSKPAAKKAAAAAKKPAPAAPTPVAGKKKPSAKKAAPKAAAKKAAKKRAPIKAAGASTAADGTAPSAT